MPLSHALPLAAAAGIAAVMLRYVLPFTLLPLLASCVGPQTPPPVAAPVRVAVPPRAVQPPVATVSDHYTGDWSVDDASPGDWRYAASSNATTARFASGGEAIAIACEGGQLILARSGQSRDAAMFTIKTSFTLRRLPTVTGMAGNQPMLTATLPARDPLWDQIVYSRGRFLVETTGLRPLIVPVTSEVSRVVEDCRG
jgi:hypothetical protein